MNQIEFIRSFKQCRNMQALPYFWHDLRILFVSGRTNRLQMCLCFRISSSKKGNVNTTLSYGP